jgi:hypothetical protein
MKPEFPRRISARRRGRSSAAHEHGPAVGVRTTARRQKKETYMTVKVLVMSDRSDEYMGKKAMAAKLSCAIDAQGLATGTGFHT